MGSDDIGVGDEVFGYRLEQVLGKGGMGTVYRATQISLGREVAVKVLNPARIRNPAQVEAFLREARAAGRLNHPHLVLVHDAHADAERGLYCYSMEYVAGQSLSRMLAEQGVLSRSSALHVLYQVAKALGHAHRNGLVHRDVKPDNILVAPGGAAKLADLGLVRERVDGLATSGTPSKLILVGTTDYSAPEQSRNPERASAASDVWSLGAVLFFMLVGRPPFGGETVIDQIVRTAIEPLQCPATMPEDCRALCARMLAKNPLDRYADGDAVVAALAALAKGEAPTRAERPADETESDAGCVDDPPGAKVPRVRRSMRRRGTRH
jgi:serine/threonine protein kinase